MKKLICALATLLPLSGCWWNDAPETYKGVATLTFENGGTFTQDFACDFRAQQALRLCEFAISFVGDERAESAVPKGMTFGMNVGISGHGRKEERYMLTMEAPYPELTWRQRIFQRMMIPWSVNPEPVAKTEEGKPAQIVTADNLEEGVVTTLEFRTTKAEQGLLKIKWEPVPANSLTS